MINLKEEVQKTVQFQFYRDGNLWYATVDHEGVVGFEFPVPISDIGNATFKATDRGMLFMRYIRKHMALIDDAKKAKDGSCQQEQD